MSPYTERGPTREFDHHLCDRCHDGATTFQDGTGHSTLPADWQAWEMPDQTWTFRCPNCHLKKGPRR